jgi:hypothetical protein
VLAMVANAPDDGVDDTALIVTDAKARFSLRE